jgi:predicted nucleotidyltransferase/energy-coupling factor transporter ATP-binding protein EcfA2
MDRLSIGGALQRYKRFFLLGDPGSGKTTVLRHIARAYAQREQTKRRYPRGMLTPILVRLADWAGQLQLNDAVDIGSAALAQMSLFDDTECASWLKDQIKDQEILVLLDGLDEVADPEAKGIVIDRIRSLVEQCPKASFIVTSRIVGFERPNLGKPFDVLALSPLSEDTVRQFAEHWFAYRHGHEPTYTCADCGRRQTRLRDALRDHHKIRPMTANPMMLTILLLLLEAGASLPQRRWELYDRICEAFLFSWEQKKRGALSSAPERLVDLEDREVLWILESLALEMQRKDWTLVSRWWLAHHISTFLRDELNYDMDRARPDADTIIWSLEERSAILKERGPEQYGFSHLAFQEYFAARAMLADANPIGTLHPYIYHPRWREVVRLVTAQLARRKATDLIRIMLDDPDPIGRFLNRGLLLVLDCLADGAPLHDVGLLRRIEEQTAELGGSKWLGIAYRALGSLTLLRDTRLDSLARRIVAAMLDKAAHALDESDQKYLLWWAASKGFLDFPKPEEVLNVSDKQDGYPITEKEVRIQGKPFTTLTMRAPERIDKAWSRALINQLTGDVSPGVRAACARELGRFVERRAPMVRDALFGALEGEGDAFVRETIVRTLAPVADRPEVKGLLLAHLESDLSSDVRGECAEALAIEAAKSPGTQAKLTQVLDSDASIEVRMGAARGLAKAAYKSHKVLELLRGTLIDRKQPDWVRASCLWALEDSLPSMSDGSELLSTLLACGQHSVVARIAAILVSRYAGTGKIPWDTLPTAAAEKLLVSLDATCAHTLDALVALVEGRELRRLGIPREARIARALASVKDKIKVSFIFGSTARHEQEPDSDIDLMIIGDTSLEEVAQSLRSAEQELGKQINAVLYSEGEWRKRSREGNPFVKELLESEKIFVFGGEGELRSMG